MLFRLITTHLRRASQLALVAWLSVCMVSILAPMARIHAGPLHVEHLCSGDELPPDAPSPLADAGPDDPALHHVLNCPLCLPVLAPPPLPLQAACGQLPAVPPQARPLAAPVVAGVVLPPVRAPPAKTWKLS